MAYLIKSSKSEVNLTYLPHADNLENGKKITFDKYCESDVPQLYAIFKTIIDEGQTYPQETVENEEDFKNYYLSHEAFVVRDFQTKEVLSAFYVKPNYPGRSSHICNGGFIVKDTLRGLGLGKFMVPWFLRVAHDLGYKASVFNLVYITNAASVRLWESNGFKEIGRVPKAGNLKGLGYVDAAVYYYDLSTVKVGLPGDWKNSKH